MRWEDRFPGKANHGENVEEIARLAEQAQAEPSLAKVIAYRAAGFAGFFLAGGAAAAGFTEIEMPRGVLEVSSILVGMFAYALAEQQIVNIRHEARMARLWLAQYGRYKDTVDLYAKHRPDVASALERSLFYDTLNRA